MSKIENDKYYTDVRLANYCWDKVFKTIGENNISEIIEPSCGDGAFYHSEICTPHFGYDVDPQCNFRNVIKSDFLKVEITYLYGRLIIGNPPYGRCMSMAQKFFKKSIEIADYIAFILPISQLNNTHSMYEFDLIYSENLGMQYYTDRYLHCCFNIYKRPKNGVLNTKKYKKLKCITIYRQDNKKYNDVDFDIRMCYWGNGTAGKVLKNGEKYSAEYKIKINDISKKFEIINLLSTFDWNEYLNCIASRKIQQFHIIDIIKNNIKDIE